MELKMFENFDRTSSYYSFFDTDRYARMLAGAWVVGEDKPRWLYYLNIIYNLALVIHAEFIILPAEILILRDTTKDLEMFVKHVGMLLTHSLGAYKTFLLHYHRGRIARMENILRDPRISYGNYDAFDPEDEYGRAKRLSTIVTVVFMSFGTGVGVVGNLAAMYSIDQAGGEKRFAANESCLEFMPYPFVFFLSTDTKYVCKWAITYNSIAVVVFAWQIIAYDSLFSTLILNIRAHFISNGVAFNSIRESCLTELILPSKTFALHDEEVPGLNRRMLREIKKSTVHLQTLLHICEEIEDIFSNVVLCQMLTTLFAIATCLVMTSNVNLLSASFATTLSFLSALSIQITVYCYFGHELTLACDSIRMALYGSNWLSSSKPYKRYILMNICRLQRPVYITVGKFSPLTLNTLVTILRASFSCFTLYNSMK